MKIEHQTGPFSVWSEEGPDGKGVKTYSVCHAPGGYDTDERHRCFAIAHGEDDKTAKSNADLISLADASPHECSVPGCSGNINRLKLEMWDEAVRLLEDCLSDEEFAQGNGYGALSFDTVRAAESLIAKAKKLEGLE